MEKYGVKSKREKVIIIGAGIGGLTAAVYAAKCGFDTELYEQHSIVGGECTGWDKKEIYKLIKSCKMAKKAISISLC